MLNLALYVPEVLDRDALAKTLTPEATKTWHPVPHSEVLDLITNEVTRAGLSIVNERHGVSHENLRAFGMIEVAGGDGASAGNGLSTVIGWRNSHDKSFPAGLAIGGGVMVCSNLSFYGEVTLARRHTRNIRRDFPAIVARGVSDLVTTRHDFEKRCEAYTETEVGDLQAHDFLINCLDTGVLPSSKITKALSEWREPSHPEFKDRNLWSLFNGVTETLKYVTNQNELVTRTRTLHGLADTRSNLVLAS